VYSFPPKKANSGWYVKRRLKVAVPAVQLKEVLNYFEHTDGHLLGNTTDNTSSNDSMTREQWSTHLASGIEWPALRNHIPCMVHGIQLVLGAFMTSLGIEGHNKSREAEERDQQFGENKSIDIGRSQRLHKQGNDWTTKVSAMRPGLAMIIETVCISGTFKSPATDLHIGQNACCIHYTDTGSSKSIPWLSSFQSTNCSTTYDGCKNTVEINTGVTWASLLITRSHLWVAEQSKIQWLPPTLHNAG